MQLAPRVSLAERERRLLAVRTAMDDEHLDAVLAYASLEVSGLPGAVVYLTGYLPMFGVAWCVVSADSCDLVLPAWEWMHTSGSTWLEGDHVHRPEVDGVRGDGGIAVLLELLKDYRRIGVVSPDAMPVGLARSLGLLGADSRFTPTALLDRIRRRKSVEEVDLIRRSAGISDAGARAFLAAARRGGCTEIELAGEIETAMRAAGLHQFTIPVVLGAGPGSLDAAVWPTERLVEPGDMVLLDCSCRHGGYFSDMARAVVCGEPSGEQQRLLGTVRSMYEESVALLKPDVDVRAPHRRAIEVAADAGYVFVHDTGHGIGCDLHEPPWIDEGSHEETFAEGMVVAVEPGLYYRDVGGARMENTILISASGPEVLHTTPLEVTGELG